LLEGTYARYGGTRRWLRVALEEKRL